MKKIKLLIIPVAALLLCGCGNKDLWDTNYTYHKAICEIGGKTKEIEIKQWTDYENGEQLQIIGKDGNTYLVSSVNCVLIKED